MLDHSWERSLGCCPYEERDWFTLQAKVAERREELEARRSELGPLDFDERLEVDHQLHRLTTRKLVFDLIASRDAARQAALEGRFRTSMVIAQPAIGKGGYSPALAGDIVMAQRID